MDGEVDGEIITLVIPVGKLWRLAPVEFVLIPRSLAPTVRRCLQAIRFILPKDTAMKVLVKWYNTYNAPGGPNMHQEWNLFLSCFMTLMGYNTDRLTWTRNVSDV